MEIRPEFPVIATSSQSQALPCIPANDGHILRTYLVSVAPLEWPIGSTSREMTP